MSAVACGMIRVMTRRHHTPRRSFREGDRIWNLFVGHCALRGTSATAVLKEAVRDYLKTVGLTEEDLRELAAADLRDLCNEPHPASGTHT